MTARLPTPGGDNNSWGTVLNDFLQQAMNSDGTLVTGSTNSYTGAANSNLATNGHPGLVQLTNDLGNSAASPKVTGIQGRAIDSSLPSDGNVLTWSTSGSKWLPQTPASGSGSDNSLDGGSATSSYGGALTIDCGSA